MCCCLHPHCCLQNTVTAPGCQPAAPSIHHRARSLDGFAPGLPGAHVEGDLSPGDSLNSSSLRFRSKHSLTLGSPSSYSVPGRWSSLGPPHPAPVGAARQSSAVAVVLEAVGWRRKAVPTAGVAAAVESGIAGFHQVPHEK
eukprot:CAMPEP_0117865368 /NCGR_PEP_ID=MMETSP0950-20121206/6696_1 /TAXON_ID=44440 /ORGANISM="Chattonella subsalsa, Strain CCMP2191" /LENGTH=140 /DNA_ID=CAMNT_0005716437 /DNA_START=698 /DNA_END=1120 /DNA_ORIENTATION=-